MYFFPNRFLNIYFFAFLKFFKFLIFLVFFLIFPKNLVLAQDSLFVQKILMGVFDAQEKFYLTDFQGNIQKFENGKSVLQYSPIQKIVFNYIDVQNPLRIFAFSADQQKIYWFDRFLRFLESYQFDNQDLSLVSLACPSADQNIWAFEENTQSLCKINPLQNQILFKINLNWIETANFSPNFLAEYQDFIFIHNPSSGLYILDNLGNIKDEISLENASNFGFLENNIYFLKKKEFVLYNFYEKTFDYQGFENIEKVWKSQHWTAFWRNKYLFFENK